MPDTTAITTTTSSSIITNDRTLGCVVSIGHCLYLSPSPGGVETNNHTPLHTLVGSTRSNVERCATRSKTNKTPPTCKKGLLVVHPW